MGPDNAEFAGPWMLLAWPHEGDAAALEDIRVVHVILNLTVLDLTSGEWGCRGHTLSKTGERLELILEKPVTRERASGAIDMSTGVWTPADGSRSLSIEEFSGRYMPSRSTAAWPGDPFRRSRPSSGDNLVSDSGEFMIDLVTNRWRMSDWIHPAAIIHAPSGARLLDLKTTYWDCRARFTGPARAELTLVRYPGVKPSLVLEIDLRAERYRVLSRAEEVAQTAGSISELAEEGYLDELQNAIGRPQADLDELNIRLNVAKSRRPGEPARTSGSRDENADDLDELEELERLEAESDEADEDDEDQDDEVDESDDQEEEDETDPPEFDLAGPISSDGQFRLEFDSIEAAPPLWVERLRIVRADTSEIVFDVTSATWDCEAAWIGECNLLTLRIADPKGNKRLVAKIDLDSMLYWEEEGPDLGIPGGVQAAPLWELQERLTLERGVIRKAERDAATGSMWPARAFGMSAPTSTSGASMTSSSTPNPIPQPAAPANAGVPDFMRLADLLRLAGESQMPISVIQALSVALMVQSGAVTSAQGIAQLKQTLGDS